MNALSAAIRSDVAASVGGRVWLHDLHGCAGGRDSPSLRGSPCRVRRRAEALPRVTCTAGTTQPERVSAMEWLLAAGDPFRAQPGVSIGDSTNRWASGGPGLDVASATMATPKTCSRRTSAHQSRSQFELQTCKHTTGNRMPSFEPFSFPSFLPPLSSLPAEQRADGPLSTCQGITCL